MLNKKLTRQEVIDFVKANYKKDLPSLILKGSPFEDVEISELAIQMKGLRTAEKKFPVLFNNPQILYPPKINLEQSSSQVTAEYKASLIKGKNCIDLTGGIGIDTYFLSKNFEQFDYCELNPALTGIAKHNFEVLGADNIAVNNTDGIEYLKHTEEYSWIYLDPARRDDKGGKVYKLSDCEPDITVHLQTFFNRSSNILIKTSPILDITAGLKELEFVKEIHILAVQNEVKELLWILEKEYKDSPTIFTINYDKDKIQRFSDKNINGSPLAEFAFPKDYIYEPNAAIMKSGLFQSLSHHLGIKKLNEHSHLFTSENLIEFPGRSFKVFDVKDFKPKNLKKHFKGLKANITTRNFPDQVKDIRKKFRIKEGGNLYLFFTTNFKNEKIVIFCKKTNLSQVPEK